MAIIKPFRGYRPLNSFAEKIASRPYDVLSSAEARREVNGNTLSFLHVVKPEIDLPETINEHDPMVYAKGKENLMALIQKKTFVQDPTPCYYIYAQTMWGHTQYGLVGCASVEDYQNNIIKKHELTRPVKEEDRMEHIRVTNFNAEPVFFAYRDNVKIDKIVRDTINSKNAEYSFVLADGVGHALWVIDGNDDVAEIEKIMREEVKYTYVADGHHRTAAAARVGLERKAANPNHTGNEEYNYFLAVHFPSTQLTIIDYNRLVKDLNGLNKDEFIEKLKNGFVVEKMGKKEYKPETLHEMSMYLDGEWYKLNAKISTYNDSDPISSLDVTVLSEQILAPILNITDLRNSERIDFVGGIRGLGELKSRVDNSEWAAAFALYPVSMKQLMDIADTGNIMPPKTTWFEPKLRSGLVLHEIESEVNVAYMPELK